MWWDILTVQIKNANFEVGKNKESNHTWHTDNWKHFFPSCHHNTKKSTSFSLHPISSTDIRKRFCHKYIQNSLHKTWQNESSLYLCRNPPHVSESEHPSHSTSLWFLPYFNHVASFGEFVLPQHVYACEHLSWSTTQFPYVALKGAAGLSVLSLHCGWHRSDGADSLCWQSVIQSVRQSCYTIPPQHTYNSLNSSTSRC